MYISKFEYDKIKALIINRDIAPVKPDSLLRYSRTGNDKGKPPGVSTELYMLSDVLSRRLRDANEAAVLVIRNAATYLLKVPNGADELYTEQKTVEYDRMFYAPRKKKMNNKQARYNIVFGDESQEQYLSNYDGVQKTNTIVINYDEDVL